MEFQTKGINIDWKIENIKCARGMEMELYSPVITVDVLDGTKWRLVVQELNECSTIWLTIKREAEDEGPELFGLHYEISIEDCDETFWTSKKTCTYIFQKDENCGPLKINLNEDHYLTTNTITIRCNMYGLHKSVSNSAHFFVRTLLRVERLMFRGVIENFSSFTKIGKKMLKIVSSPTNERLVEVNFFLQTNPDFTCNSPRDTSLYIEIIPIEKDPARFYNFKVFILDSYYKETEAGKFELEFHNFGRKKFNLPEVSKEYLMENADTYLPNDTLSLQCELAFWSGVEYDQVEKTEFETDAVAEETQTDFSSGLKSLIGKEVILCDTKLKTATETFPAHTAILSAKSPVFDAMFKSNMKETIKKCVHIDDVDAETVKHMLVFLYSNTVEKLEWKRATKLYVASDKYEIRKLKRKCTKLLEQSIDFSNFCVLLHFADIHQNDTLKSAVKTYIAENHREAFQSNQWRNLEKNLPQLSIEIFRAMYFCCTRDLEE